MGSAEQIKLAWPDKIARAALARGIAESANNAGWCARQFAADQTGDAGQLVGNGFLGHAQPVAVRVAASAIIQQRLHAGDADGYFAQAFAPGTSEAIRDDHGNAQASGAAQRQMQRLSRAVWIQWQ